MMSFSTTGFFEGACAHRHFLNSLGTHEDVGDPLVEWTTKGEEPVAV